MLAIQEETVNFCLQCVFKKLPPAKNLYISHCRVFQKSTKWTQNIGYYASLVERELARAHALLQARILTV
jgi:hypothetical protein